jgi:hypothetical protein
LTEIFYHDSMGPFLIQIESKKTGLLFANEVPQGRLMSRFFIFLALSVCAALTAAENEPKLHALLICDTYPSKLDYAYRTDLERMTQNVRGIAFQSDLPLHLNILTGNKVSSKSIKRWISKLPKSTNDTVLVYYVGRQARHAKSKEKWPSIMPVSGKRSMSSMEVATRIQKCDPQLTLVFFDCYDRKLEIPKQAFPSDIIPVNEDYTNIKPLFTVARGLFMACSGPKDSKNVCITQCGKMIGGAFTTALMESIALNISSPSWGKGRISLDSYYDDIYKPRRKPLILSRVIDPRYEHICKELSFLTCSQRR